MNGLRQIKNDECNEIADQSFLGEIMQSCVGHSDRGRSVELSWRVVCLI